jgi:hypothetical protein
MTDQEKPVETEEIQVKDTPITIERQADDSLSIRLPEGLTDTEKAEYKELIETGEASSLIKALHRKNQIWNEELAKIDKIKADLRQPEVKDEKPKQDAPKPQALWQKLGLESEAEVDDYAVDNPAAYTKALAQETAQAELAEYQRKLDAKLEAQLTQQKEELSQKTLIQTIKAQDIDPIDVQAFAQYNGMPFSEKAFNLYQQLHRDKSNPVLNAMVDAQKKQINYVEQANFRQKGDMSPEEVRNMSDSELEAYAKYQREQAARS